MTETEAALREALTNWMRLYAGARRPKSDSNTAFVDIRDLEAYAASTRAALALPSEGGWRPMDSAPRDGTYIILFNPKYPRPFTGWLSIECVEERDPTILGATHWQPLPALPTTRSDTDAN